MWLQRQNSSAKERHAGYSGILSLLIKKKNKQKNNNKKMVACRLNQKCCLIKNGPYQILINNISKFF